MTQYMQITYEMKGNWMLFPAVLFSFSVGTTGKTYCVCKSLRNFHTCHPKISSDRQGGELVGVKSTSTLRIVLLPYWMCAERAWQWRQGKAILAIISPASTSDVNRRHWPAFITAHHHGKQVHDMCHFCWSPVNRNPYLLPHLQHVRS